MAELVRHRLVPIVALIILASGGCASAVDELEDAVDGDNIPAQFEESVALREVFDDWAANAEGGGVAFVGTADSGHLLDAGTDPQTGEPLNAEQPVRVGSISKIFTASMVMQLVDEGLVELNAPISTYVDDLEIANDVSVRQLLAHETGIPNYTDTEGFFRVVLDNPTRTIEPRDLIAFTNGESDFDPGSQFAYSNTNYIVAGMLIEAVTGQSLNTELETRIVKPAGLLHTAFDDGTISDVAGGHSQLTPTGNSYSQSYTSIAQGAWAAGALVSTVEDLALFFRALFYEGLVSDASLALMTDGLNDGADYGLGLHAGPDFGVGHGGSIIGFNSMVQIDPETQDLVAVVVNNDARDPEVAAGVLAEVIGR